jgi:glycosyltransferase involved in cell wall biosynthesis
MPIKIAAKVDKADEDYFNVCIRPLLDRQGVEYVGEIGEHEKNEFLGGACALLFPIDWPEPFGLVMIEAMACGTPVIAFDCGAVREVMDDGITGFVVRDIDAAVAAVGKIGSIDRCTCRKIFETRFSARRMASDYVGVYRTLKSLHEIEALPQVAS